MAQLAAVSCWHHSTRSSGGSYVAQSKWWWMSGGCGRVALWRACGPPCSRHPLCTEVAEPSLSHDKAQSYFGPVAKTETCNGSGFDPPRARHRPLWDTYYLPVAAHFCGGRHLEARSVGPGFQCVTALRRGCITLATSSPPLPPLAHAGTTSSWQLRGPSTCLASHFSTTR